MKYILWLFILLGLNQKSFSQETVIKEKTKTKIEGPNYEHKVVRTEVSHHAATPVLRLNESSHRAYGTYHRRVSYHPRRTHYRVQHGRRIHYRAHKVHHRLHVHTVGKLLKSHHREVKKKWKNGKYKAKYE